MISYRYIQIWHWKISGIFRKNLLMGFSYTQLPNQSFDVFIVYIWFPRLINLFVCAHDFGYGRKSRYWWFDLVCRKWHWNSVFLLSWNRKQAKMQFLNGITADKLICVVVYWWFPAILKKVLKKLYSWNYIWSEIKSAHNVSRNTVHCFYCVFFITDICQWDSKY